MFSSIRRWLDRRIVRRSSITPAQWQAAFDALPLLQGYSREEKHRLTELATVFLHRKVFEGAAGFRVTEPMTLHIALQACIPVLNLGLDAYDGWISVIVYPAGFAPKRVVTDQYGVQHNVQSNLSGESWQRGPVILAWDATEHAGMIDGHNVVIHEFAHKLDTQNGPADGFPPLHADMSSTEWYEVFSAGYADFQQRCDSGDYIGIDCYGAASPAEFFAVLSENFFERPELIQQYYAAIYQQLKKYYRQDPLERLVGVVSR